MSSSLLHLNLPLEILNVIALFYRLPPEFAFVTNDLNAAYVELSNAGKTIQWISTEDRYRIIHFGPKFLDASTNDKCLIHFRLESNGRPWVIAFGFICPAFQEYDCWSGDADNRSLTIAGDGGLYWDPTVFQVDEKYRQENGCDVADFSDLFTAESKDTIAVSVDMSTKTGQIWNLDESKNEGRRLNVEFKADAIGIIVAMGKLDGVPQIITAVKQEIEIHLKSVL